MVAVNGQLEVEAGSDGAKKMSRCKVLLYQALRDVQLVHASRMTVRWLEC